MDEVTKFLSKMGMKSEEMYAGWKELIRPASVSIILGKVGSGKSGLAYYLTEWAESQYDLTPVVVNLPSSKQSLLPPHYTVKSLQEIKNCSDAVVIIDEGTTMIPAGGQKLEELIKGCSALCRQRNQIIFFIFHASSDAGIRVLRGVDNIFLKEPSMRQIQHGAKDEWWRGLLLEAKEKFKEIRLAAGNPNPVVCLQCRDSSSCPTCPKTYTFVDSEEPEFRGMLKNPLPKFWTQELSCAWASGVEDSQLPLISSSVVQVKGRKIEVSPKLAGTPANVELTTEERMRKVIPELTDDQLELITQMDANHSLEELRDMCRAKGLSVSGDKKTLAARLLREGERVLQPGTKTGGEK